jgi:hypothetical protein
MQWRGRVPEQGGPNVAQGRIHRERARISWRRRSHMLQHAHRAIAFVGGTVIRPPSLIGGRRQLASKQANLHELDRLGTAITAAYHLPHGHPARRLDQARQGWRQHRQTQAGQHHAGEPAVSVRQCEDRHSRECAAKPARHKPQTTGCLPDRPHSGHPRHTKARFALLANGPICAARSPHHWRSKARCCRALRRQKPAP